jgi:N-acyl-D-aspartate/D-glutamate deacylase
MVEKDGPPISSLARRRLLVALGYGAANIGVASLVGWRARFNSTPAAPSATSTLVDLTAAVGMAEPQPLPEAAPQPGPDHTYQQVIVNGRVIDPGTGFDAVVNVGIDGGVVTAVSSDPLVGAETIDATGLVVAPGFIDLLSYEPNPFGIWYKVADGVTTNLAMHGVNNYAEAFFARYEGTSPIHFGGAFHHHFMRAADLRAGVEDALDPVQLDTFDALARASLEQGFAGVSFSPEYSPGTTTEELLRLTASAVELGHMAFFHARYSDPFPPGTSDEAIDEILQVATETGASVHIEHLSSTGATFKMAEVLDRLDAARASGIDVTACVYPYDFWGTFLASSRFAPGWQERFGLTYSDLQVAGSEVVLSEATFDQAVADNLLVAALGSIPEEEVQLALKRDWVMVASDAILEPELNNHPRAAGTFARTLGRYVRDLGVIDLPAALAKMTILPAQRVEAMIPDMARKGRLRRGADADIVIFDPATIADQATVAAPKVPSVGVHWVLVEGQVAIRNGEQLRNVRAGRALRSATSI